MENIIRQIFQDKKTNIMDRLDLVSAIPVKTNILEAYDIINKLEEEGTLRKITTGRLVQVKLMFA